MCCSHSNLAFMRFIHHAAPICSSIVRQLHGVRSLVLSTGTEIFNSQYRSKSFLGHFHSGIPNVSTLDPIVQHIIISVNPTVRLIDMFYKPAAVPKSGFGHPGSVCRRCGCNRPLTRRYIPTFPSVLHGRG